MQLSASQIFLVQAEMNPDILIGQLCRTDDLFLLVFLHANLIQSLTLDCHLLLLAVVLNTPELHLKVQLLTLLIVEEAKLVDQASLLVRQVVEADVLAELPLEVLFERD